MNTKDKNKTNKQTKRWGVGVKPEVGRVCEMCDEEKWGGKKREK